MRTTFLILLTEGQAFVTAQFATFLLSLALVSTHTVLLFYQCFSHFQEGLVDAEARLGTRLENLQVVSLFKGLDVVVGHLDLSILLVFIVALSILADVSLISQHDYIDVGAAVLLDFLQPAVNVLE